MRTDTRVTDLTRDLPDLLTPGEVAKFLRVTPMTIYRQIGKGLLAAVKVGGAIRILKAELERYLEGGDGGGS